MGGQGLHLRSHPHAGGRPDGQRLGAQANRLRRYLPHGPWRLRLRLRGRPHPPHELCLAERVETSPHLVQAFMAAVEGMRVSLGPVKVLQYVMQGLYHPARKVRDVYWKVYNTLYIGGQDALVVGYPRIPNDAKNSYARYELDYVL